MRTLFAILALCCLSFAQTTILPKTTVFRKTTIFGQTAAGGTPTLVQTTANCNFFGTSATTATIGGSAATGCPAATGWTGNVGSSALIAGFIWRTGADTLNSVASDNGGTCVVRNAAGTPGTSNAQRIYGFYCYGVTGGAKSTITLTFSGSRNFWYAVAHEVHNILASGDPLDGDIYVGLGATTNAANGCTTGSFTTAANGDYILGGIIDDGGGAITYTAGTTSQAWTRQFGPDSTHSEAMTSEDGIQTTASASTVIAFTGSAGSNPTIGAMAFKHN